MPQSQRGGIPNFMPSNHRAPSNMNPTGNYGGQGLKRMRGDDFRNDGLMPAHRMKWDNNEEEKSINFVERNDIDQRSE